MQLMVGRSVQAISVGYSKLFIRKEFLRTQKLDSLAEL